MILTSSAPFSPQKIEQLKVQFDVYVKTVIDKDQQICSPGMDCHYKGDQLLLKRDSLQSNIWGGGIDLEVNEIDDNSFIIIRPQDNSTKNEIQSESIKTTHNKLIEYFAR